MKREPMRIKKEGEPVTLEEKIMECMIHNPSIGGRYTLEIDNQDAEEIMNLATGEYHNSFCPEPRKIIVDNGKSEIITCGKIVSCVCTEKCKHIWYCQDHVLNHTHRQSIKDQFLKL